MHTKKCRKAALPRAFVKSAVAVAAAASFGLALSPAHAVQVAGLGVSTSNPIPSSLYGTSGTSNIAEYMAKYWNADSKIDLTQDFSVALGNSNTLVYLANDKTVTVRSANGRAFQDVTLHGGSVYILSETYGVDVDQQEGGDVITQTHSYDGIQLIGTAESLFGGGSAENLDNASVVTKSETVNGNETVNGDSTVTGKTTTGTLEAGSSKLGDTETGNLTAKGDAEVTGNVAAGGNASVAGDLTVEGKTQTGTLEAGASNLGDTTTGNLTAKGDAEVTGNVTAGGSASVAGDLTVDGKTQTGTLEAGSSKLGDTETGNLTAKGDAEVTGNVAAGGNASVAGDLTVDGKTQTGTLEAGKSNLGDTTTGNLSAKGDAEVTGNVAAGGNASVAGDLTVEGKTQTGTLEAGSSNLGDTTTGNFTAKGEAVVTGNIAAGGSASVAGGLTVEGKTQTGTLEAGSSKLGNTETGNLTAKGDAEVTGNVAAGGNASVAGDLTVDGKTQTGTLEAGASKLGDTETGNLAVNGNAGVTGDVAAAGSASIGQDLTVEGKTVTGSFEAKKDAAVGGSLAVAGDASVEGALRVKGGLELSDAAAEAVRDTARTAVAVTGADYATVTKIAGTGAEPDRYQVSVKAEGRVESGSSGLVTGGAVHEALEGVREIAKAHTTLAASNSTLTVTEGVNGDGGRAYGLAVNPNLSLDTLSVGSGSGSRVFIDANGIDAGGGRVTGIAGGRVAAGSTDAVNGGQLYEAERRFDRGVTDLHEEIAKVGAGASALAALHPQDYDENHKFSVAAGLGHFKSREGVAVGAFLRPTENLMFSAGYAASASDNHMVNLGVSYRFGGAGPKTASSPELQATVTSQAAELRDLKAQVAALETQNEALRVRFEQALATLAPAE